MANLIEQREVPVSIGRRTYHIKTELDDDVLGRVVGIVNEASGSINKKADHDSLLMLTCLQLAYNIERISHLLESFDKRLECLTHRVQIEKE